MRQTLAPAALALLALTLAFLFVSCSGLGDSPSLPYRIRNLTGKTIHAVAGSASFDLASGQESEVLAYHGGAQQFHIDGVPFDIGKLFTYVAGKVIVFEISMDGPDYKSSTLYEDPSGGL